MPQALTIWSLATGQPGPSIPVTDAIIQTIGVSADRQLLYTVSPKSVRFFRIDDPAHPLVFELTANQADAVTPQPTFLFAAVSPDFRFVAVSTFRGVLLFNTENHELVKTLPLVYSGEPFDGPPLFLAFSSDLRTLGAADEKDRVYAWDIVTGELLYRAKKPLVNLNSAYGPFPRTSFDVDQKLLIEETDLASAPGDHCPGLTAWKVPDDAP
jgi:hypothetical protein